MRQVFHRTYIAIFRRYPVLCRMALVVVLGEIVQSSVNNYSLPFYVTDDLKQPGRTLGLLISVFLISEMMLKLPFGHLSDRHGRRPFAIAGIAASATTALVIALAPAAAFAAFPVLIYVVLLPLRALDGAGAAALWPPLFASVPDHVPTRERGVAMSVMNTAYLTGLTFGPALAGAAMSLSRVTGIRPGWEGRAPFAMVVLAAAAGAIVASTLPRRHGQAAHESHQAHGRWPSMRVTSIVMVITLGEMFATASLAPYLPLYVQQVTSIPKERVGFLLVGIFLPAGLLGIPLGHVADRWPKRRVVQLALCITAVGLWAVTGCRTLLPLAAAGVVVMLGFMLGLPAWLALISDLAPRGGAGRVMGLMSTAQGAGAFLGPVVGGYLWDQDIHYPFYAAALLLTVTALVALLFIRKTERRSGAGG